MVSPGTYVTLCRFVPLLPRQRQKTAEGTVNRSSGSVQKQHQMTAPAAGAAASVNDAVMTTSGSFNSWLAGESASVKGKPIKSVRSTLETR
jgi:hypothetical protein